MWAWGKSGAGQQHPESFLWEYKSPAWGQLWGVAIGNIGLLMDAAFLFPQGGQEAASTEPALLRQLLSVLRHIGQSVATRRMTCSNLVICLGPNLLSPAQEEQLELQAMLAEREKGTLPSAAGCSLCGP